MLDLIQLGLFVQQQGEINAHKSMRQNLTHLKIKRTQEKLKLFKNKLSRMLLKIWKKSVFYTSVEGGMFSSSFEFSSYE
jgi:hypothetical protein